MNRTVENPEQIFVYGSLMEGFFNYRNHFAGKVKSRAPGKIRAKLFHQPEKGYPAAVEGSGWVYGELLELEDFQEMIKESDQTEHFFGPGNAENEYERRLSLVTLDSGDSVYAYVYWYAREDLGTDGNPAVPVPGGNWRDFMNGESPPGKTDT